MGSEKYKLKWSKYESNVLNAFKDLFETEALSDVVLFCEGQTFKAHRLVLSACSTHFQSLFSHTMNGPINNQLYVILDGTRADDLQILLHFMYRGEAYLHQDRINSVLRTAEVLQVKGLSEGPRSIEVNDPLQPPLQRWSPGPQQRSQSPIHRNTGGGVGIMGTLKRKNDNQHHHHQQQQQQQQQQHHHSRERDHFKMMSPPQPESLPSPTTSHNISYPSTRGNFGVYGSAFRGMGHTGGSTNRGGVPDLRSASYSPSRDGNAGRLSVKSSCSSPVVLLTPSGSMYAPHPLREEPIDREDPYKFVRSSSGGNGTLTRAEILDRHTPSDKSKRHYDRRSGGGNCDQSSSRGTPPSPAPTPGSVSSMGKSTPVGGIIFPSDSTTSDRDRESGNNIGIRAMYKDMRRQADDMDQGGKLYAHYRDTRGEDQLRIRDDSPGDVDSRLTIDTSPHSPSVNSLDTFHNIAQVRDRFMPTAVLPGGISAVSIAAQGALSGSASDYMRLAMPVRDPDNGDAISGSGTKLRCPFCERTYGYETNLRAHIRQRHQGIRVSCPYCPRTFTRNNTVRRHVQREHRNLGGRIPTKFSPTRVMPDPIRSMAAAATIAAMNQQEAAARTSIQNDVRPGSPQA